MSDNQNMPIKNQFDEEAYASTQALIQRMTQQQDTLNEQLKEQRNMLQNIFSNDEELTKVKEVADEVKTKMQGRKDSLNESSEVLEIKSKIAETSEDLKMIKDSLNTHLLNYYQMTGSTSVDMPDGDEREFKINAAIKPRKNS